MQSVNPLPGLGRLYFDALRQLRKGDARRELGQEIEGSLYACPVDRRRMRAFCEHAGMVGTDIPLSYVYVMTDRSRFALINSEDCPYPAAGLIQTSLTVEVDRMRLPSNDGSAIVKSRLSAGDLQDNGSRRLVLKTQLLDTQMNAIGKVIATYRVRGPKPEGRGKQTSRARAIAPEAIDIGTGNGPARAFRFAAGRGRAYARISGDWNPVHLHGWLARPFGFRRHILQGLDLVACAEGLLGGRPAAGLSCTFEKPVFLPSTVKVALDEHGDQTGFVIAGDGGKIVHTRGHFDHA